MQPFSVASTTTSESEMTTPDRMGLLSILDHGSMDDMRVLVTDGAMNKSLAIVRAIADVTTHVGVTSRFPISVAGTSRYADKRYWIRDRDPSSYVRRLNQIAAAHDYDQLLPVGGSSFELASNFRHELALPVERILPPREAMDVALAKGCTYALAEDVGIPTPRTVRVAEPADLESAANSVGFPAVVKTGTETGTRFVRRVESETELERAYEDYRRENTVDPVVQEYLPGVASGYFAFYLDGELVAGYSHKRVREYPPEGGASACAESEENDELRRYAQDLLDSLEWHGVAMVEFKEDTNGVPSIVEINPKFWGSIDLGIASGLNFPRALLEYTAGKTAFSFEFTPTRYSWPLSGDLTHVWRRPNSARAVLADLIDPTTRTNLRRDDPLPHVVETLVTVIRQDI